MTKRQCLTCGFFQPSGSDSMGWCNNPRRKIASDIRLYVRAHELPCRDSWDHDLWEDKATFSAPSDVVLSNDIGPVAPASIDDLVFLASAERAPEPVQFGGTAGGSESPESSVDRVIREESTSLTAMEARAGSVRGSVRRAHQQLLADKRTERFADGTAASMDGGFSLPVASSPGSRNAKPADRLYEAEKPVVDYAATRPAFNAVPPVQPSEMDRSIPRIAIYPTEDDRFSSVPRPVEGLSLPKLAPRGRTPVIRSTYLEDDIDDDAAPNPPAAGDRVEASVPAPEFAPEHVETLVSEAAPLQGDARGPGADERFESDVAFAGDELIGQDFAPVARPRLRAGGLFRSRRRQHAEPIYEPAPLVDEYRDEVNDREPELFSAPIFDLQAPVRPDSKLSLRAVDEAVVDEPEELDDEEFGPLTTRRTALWAGVPRMCRTCRDFRPAESGDRGWCNNKWAFNHRRMVDADERPCDSSVGCWWLPHDDIWLDASDISAHGQPTPMLDLWLGQRRGRDSEAESASIGRRRRG